MRANQKASLMDLSIGSDLWRACSKMHSIEIDRQMKNAFNLKISAAEINVNKATMKILLKLTSSEQIC